MLMFITGFLPFALGHIQNCLMLSNADAVLPYTLISVLFLFLWAFLAFLLNKRGKRTKQTLLFLNLPAAAVLALLGVQELLLHRYWANAIGIWTQIFYLPLVNLGALLTGWSHSLFAAYAASFLLILAAAYAGCRLRKGER